MSRISLSDSTGYAPVSNASIADINRANAEAWNQHGSPTPARTLNSAIHLVGVTQDSGEPRNVYEWNGKTYTSTIGANLDAEGVPVGLRAAPEGLPTGWASAEDEAEARMVERFSVHR